MSEIVSLFPEHEVFKNFKIDKTLMNYKDFGLINLASNDTKGFYLVCDTPDFNLEDPKYLNWALLPMSNDLYEAFMTTKEKDFKNVSILFDLVFNNPEAIYYTHRDFEDPSKDYVKELNITEESEDTYNFMKMYRRLKNAEDFVAFSEV